MVLIVKKKNSNHKLFGLCLVFAIFVVCHNSLFVWPIYYGVNFFASFYQSLAFNFLVILYSCHTLQNFAFANYGWKWNFSVSKKQPKYRFGNNAKCIWRNISVAVTSASDHPVAPYVPYRHHLFVPLTDIHLQGAKPHDLSNLQPYTIWAIYNPNNATQAFKAIESKDPKGSKLMFLSVAQKGTNYSSGQQAIHQE
jgi:hypothetical protein